MVLAPGIRKPAGIIGRPTVRVPAAIDASSPAPNGGGRAVGADRALLRWMTKGREGDVANDPAARHRHERQRGRDCSECAGLTPRAASERGAGWQGSTLPR